MRMPLLAVVVLAAALALAAAASGSRSSAAATAAIPGCAKASLNLLKDGRLTLGADNPAYPPWFGGDQKNPWKVSNPYSGKGYESAVSYAVAGQLGFAKNEVDWVYVPFAKSYRPGKKPFDFYITQVSYSPARDRVVDFSKSYYFVNQTVVGLKSDPIAKVRSVAGLKPFRFGAQVGTTSYTYITTYIAPGPTPRAYDTNDLAVQALKNGLIDGLVVDAPTAFYVTAAQVPNSVIVGRLPTKGSKERFGLVFQQGNPLRVCVNKALDRLWRNGTIKALQRTWLAKVGGAPELK